MSYAGLATDIGNQVAAVDLTNSKFLFAVLGAGGISPQSVAGAYNIGVIQTNPIAGLAVNVRVAGVSKIVASAAIAKGAKVSSDATGKAKTAGAGDHVRGLALEAAAGANSLIAILLIEDIA